jgi:hypothetical protein
MATNLPLGQAQISGNVLFYSKPEPLSSETHAGLGVRRLDKPFAFAAEAQVAPLTVAEFPLASLCYPIIFAGDRYQPLAVMGVNANRNIFIQPDGMFEPGVYIPAYIRRYPFVLAADDVNQKMVVCVDRGAPMLGELPDIAFFDAKGEPTEYTKGCIQFCQNFEVEIRRTESFVGLLKDLDLLETRTSTFTPMNQDGTVAGAPQPLAEYFAVSEEKMKALPDEKIRELLEKGAMGAIYAHLSSLLSFDRLVVLATVRQAVPPPANLN